MFLTFAIPALKTKGLRKPKTHSKATGGFPNSVIILKIPERNERRNTALLVVLGFLKMELIRKVKWICKNKETLSWPNAF